MKRSSKHPGYAKTAVADAIKKPTFAKAAWKKSTQTKEAVEFSNKHMNATKVYHIKAKSNLSKTKAAWKDYSGTKEKVKERLRTPKSRRN